MSDTHEQSVLPCWDLPTALGVYGGMAFMGGAFGIALITVLSKSADPLETGSTVSLADRINVGILFMTVVALCVQTSMQIRSNRIAYSAALLQQSVIRDTKRDRADNLLASVVETVNVIHGQILIYRGRQEIAIQIGANEEQEKLRAALTEVLLSEARLAQYRTKLIVTLPGISAPLVTALHGWIELVKSITKRDATGSPTVYVMTHNALQDKLQGQLKEVMDDIGIVLGSEQYRQPV